jgi:hypothetical protein
MKQVKQYEIFYFDKHTEIMNYEDTSNLVDELEMFERDDVNMIHELENEKHRRLLNIVYVDMKSLKKAANIMCFSYDYIKELHLEALSTFTEKFPPQTP